MDDQAYQYFAQRIAALEATIARLRAFVRMADAMDCMGEFESTEVFVITDEQCRARWRSARAAVGELGE